MRVSARLAQLRGRRSGQALIEYVLLVALISTVSIGFLKFFAGSKNSFFVKGLSGLSQNASACMTHSDAGGAGPSGKECPPWR